jgi:hypothetical protein
MPTRPSWASSDCIPSNATLNPGTAPPGTWTIIPGTEQGIGTGRNNTALILAIDPNAPGAKWCVEYSNNGKTDWFLPSVDELTELYRQRTDPNIGITTGSYWTSYTQFSDMATTVNFTSGLPNYNAGKNLINNFYVRPIRAF